MGLINFSCCTSATKTPISQPGQTVGIVGVSGGGKSTLINLLPRFLDPTSGVVKLDSVDLKQWDLQYAKWVFG